MKRLLKVTYTTADLQTSNVSIFPAGCRHLVKSTLEPIMIQTDEYPQGRAHYTFMYFAVSDKKYAAAGTNEDAVACGVQYKTEYFTQP